MGALEILFIIIIITIIIDAIRAVLFMNRPQLSPRRPLSSLDWAADSPAAAGKLQALVYDILPSTTAVFSYATGSRKLSANEQFFCQLMLKQ